MGKTQDKPHPSCLLLSLTPFCPSQSGIKTELLSSSAPPCWPHAFCPPAPPPTAALTLVLLHPFIATLFLRFSFPCTLVFPSLVASSYQCSLSFSISCDFIFFLFQYPCALLTHRKVNPEGAILQKNKLHE